MIVCIAEKPSVALEIAKILGASQRKEGYFEGNGYQVTWTFGHLCMLKSPEDYKDIWKKWQLSSLPMIPDEFEIKLIDTPVYKKQFKIIKSLYKKAAEIINCGDAGQEGELIQRWVMELAGTKCPIKRLWISSLTEEAIRNGFHHLKDQADFDTLYQAGLARAVGDWLLGMNCSRLYTIKYGGYGNVLSIGRVQTPTLAMIVNRQNQIDQFRPEPYWVLKTKYRGTTFTYMKGSFSVKEEGLNALCYVMGKQFVICHMEEKKSSEQSPQLYDLTSLQVDCNKKFGLSAEQTLNTIQGLYEKKMTTYPRVDTRFLSDDIYLQCPRILTGLKTYSSFVKPLEVKPLAKSSRVFNTSKVTDHHAIIPTGLYRSDLSDTENKVYDLIAKRFIAVFYPACVYSTTTVIGDVSGLKFKATGKTIQEPGWRTVYGNDIQEDEKTEILPSFKYGESGQHTPELVEKMTTPPKHYTEATLLQAMETAGKLVEDDILREALKENGIGRPSSRAGIIETLLKRGYVKREKKNLVATQTGKDLIDIIQSSLLKSPELTGLWEKKLRDIEHGTYKDKQFLDELIKQIYSIIDDVKKDSSEKKISEGARSSKTKSSKGSPSYRKAKGKHLR